jgi:hypothetical protein
MTAEDSAAHQKAALHKQQEEQAKQREVFLNSICKGFDF